MTPMTPLRRFAASLSQNQRGSVALTFLLTSALMIGGTLGAIDLVRYNIAESRLQNAVDATSLSAAQALNAWDPAVNADKTAWQNYASAFFSANLPNNYHSSNITAGNIATGLQYCTADATGAVTCPSTAVAGMPISAQYVNLNVQGTMPLLSTGFLGRPTFTLLAGNQVIKRLKNNTEIVLALEDSTYTGASNNANIQAAAKSLVSAALGSMNLSGSTAQGIRVGVVPFSAMVRMNPGSAATATPNTKNWVKTVATTLGVNAYIQSGNWLGCVAEPYPPGTGYWGQGTNPALPAAKYTPPDPNAAAITTNSFQPVFMPIPATSKGYNTLGAFVDNSSAVTVTQLGANDVRTTTTVSISKQNQSNLIPRAPNAALAVPNDTVNYRFIGMDNSSTTTWGNLNPIVYSAFEPDSCAYVGKTQFLSQNTTTLNAAIDTMQGNSNSESMIAGGLLWSWRMLVPEWSTNTAGTGRGWDDNQPGLPADPANTDPTKPMVQGRAIVLVSTGMNSTASSTGTYRAPLMYNPASPVQQSDFQMVVNYCGNGTATAPAPNSSGVMTCSSGTLYTGVITTPSPSTINGTSPVGNGGGAHGGMFTASQIGVWPSTSLTNLDLRSSATVISAFAGSGNKLVGSHATSSFQDPNATIGWPAGTTSGLTTADATAYMQAVCTAIKNESSTYPIRLYTVFLSGSSSSGSGQTDLATCASGPAYAYTNSNTNNLKSTFSAILGSMTELRLTQ